MNGKITYHQQVSYCGKPRCRKCREGVGHGPYWYSYQTVNGRTTRTYIGKSLPPEIQVAREAQVTSVGEVATPSNFTDVNTVVLRIYVLGHFRLERRSGQQWQTVTDAVWQQQRVRVLLAFLICHPGRKVSRSQVMDALWPKSDRETATNHLNKTVHHLRKVLGSSQEILLHAEGEFLILAEQSQVWVDADAFEVLLAQEDASLRERSLRKAAALYSGDFLLEGRQIEWVATRRQKLRQSWIALLLELADLSMTDGATSGAIDLLDRLLANDPTNEAAVQRLITILAQLKRRGEALRVYHRLTEGLRGEYGTMPSERTRLLYEAVRQGDGVVGDLVVTQSVEKKTPVKRSPKGTSKSSEALVNTHGPVRVSRKTRFPIEPIGRSHQTPLVGRTRELEVLRTMLLDVEQGVRSQVVGQRRSTGIPLDTLRRPQWVVLLGEAGIGKTRLAEEISREAQQRRWKVIWSRAYAQESGVPYRLWTETLRKVLDGGGGPASSLSMSALETLSLQPLTALLPELGEMIPQVGQQTGRSSGWLTPEQEQLHLWEAMRDLLTTISESMPLLIVLDDIQWADGRSAELLGYLARHLYGYPILLVGTCRETELPTRPPHLLRTLIAHMQREHSVKTVNVEPLTNEQIGILVSGMPDISEPTVQHIQTHAAGNPFFAEELARITPPTLPKTVAAALDHRMSRLSNSCQQLLGNAAVLGGSFEFPVIASMESGNPASDEDAVLSLLEEALQSGVLTEEGTGTRITYHFWHPLLVSHLYERVSATRRARLHRRAAEILQHMHQGREEEIAATITHHLVAGGAEASKIAHYAEIAGDRAYALSAYSEAERHYLLAVEQMGTQVLADETTHLVYLLERLAECTMIRGNFEEARHLYEQIIQLRSHEQSQYEAQVQALLWSEIGLTWRYTGDNVRAKQCCGRGEQVLLEAGVVGGPAWAGLRYQQSRLYGLEGRYEEAHQAAQEALSLFEQKLPTMLKGGSYHAHTTRIQRTLEGDPVDLGRTNSLLGTIANDVGQRTKALAHLNTALALYEQYDHKREIAHVSCNLGHIYLKKAENELAQAALRRSLNLAERVGDDPLISVIYSNLGELAASLGEMEEAETWYKKGLALAERFNDRVYMSRWNAALATVLQGQGKLDMMEKSKLDEAAACIIRALRIGRAMQNHPCIGVALVALGNMRIAQALTEQLPKLHMRQLLRARADVKRALALSGLQAETRTEGQLALAHISFLLGQIDNAREEVDEVIEEAKKYELALVEERAKRLLLNIIE